MEEVLSCQLEEVLSCVTAANTALVVDDASAELLHWSASLQTLLARGVSDIKPFSSFSALSPHTSGILFLLSSLIQDQHLRVVIDMVQSGGSDIRHVTIVTPYSENFHTSVELETHKRTQVTRFEDLQAQVRRVCAPEVKRVLIRHIPLFACMAQTNLRLFLAPGFHRMFSMCFQPTLHLPDAASVPLEQHPAGVQLAVKQLCGVFWRLLVEMNAAFTCFSLGPLSRLIATRLASIPPPKTAHHQLSLLFIDRSLDLTAPLHHSDKCFADQLFKSFSPVTPDSNDASVPVDSLLMPHISPGCLAHPGHEPHENLMRRCFARKRREILTASFRQLLDICVKEDVQLPEKFSKPDFSSVKTIFSCLAQNRQALKTHGEIIELISAIWLAAQNTSFDKMQAIEKSILQSLGDDDSPSIASQIISLLQGDANDLDASEICALLISFSSLVNSDEMFSSRTEEKQLINALSSKFKNSSASGDEDSSECLLTKSPADLVEFLKRVSSMRKSLTQYQNVLSVQDTVPTYRPLLEQVCNDVFLNESPSADIECNSNSGLHGLLKTGFSYFMPAVPGGSKARPAADCSTLIVFVVGGITPGEVKIVKDLANKHGLKCRLYIGATSLISSHETIISQCATLVQ